MVVVFSNEKWCCVNIVSPFSAACDNIEWDLWKLPSTLHRKSKVHTTRQTQVCTNNRQCKRDGSFNSQQINIYLFSVRMCVREDIGFTGIFGSQHDDEHMLVEKKKLKKKCYCTKINQNKLSLEMHFYLHQQQSNGRPQTITNEIDEWTWYAWIAVYKSAIHPTSIALIKSEDLNGKLI